MGCAYAMNGPSDLETPTRVRARVRHVAQDAHTTRAPLVSERSEKALPTFYLDLAFV